MPQFDRLGNDVDLAISDERYDLDDMSYEALDVAGHSRWDYMDPYQEAMEDELGAAMGDPRRCPHHPHVITSSPDGMFDAPCDVCEGMMSEDAERERYEEWLKTAPKCEVLGTNVACDASGAAFPFDLAHCVTALPTVCEDDPIPF
jgi:hypothetical protein